LEVWQRKGLSATGRKLANDTAMHADGSNKEKKQMIQMIQQGTPIAIAIVKDTRIDNLIAFTISFFMLRVLASAVLCNCRVRLVPP
jgi:hypothetical protein